MLARIVDACEPYYHDPTPRNGGIVVSAHTLDELEQRVNGLTQGKPYQQADEIITRQHIRAYVRVDEDNNMEDESEVKEVKQVEVKPEAQAALIAASGLNTDAVHVARTQDDASLLDQLDQDEAQILAKLAAEMDAAIPAADQLLSFHQRLIERERLLDERQARLGAVHVENGKTRPGQLTLERLTKVEARRDKAQAERDELKAEVEKLNKELEELKAAKVVIPDPSEAQIKKYADLLDDNTRLRDANALLTEANTGLQKRIDEQTRELKVAKDELVALRQKNVRPLLAAPIGVFRVLAENVTLDGQAGRIVFEVNGKDEKPREVTGTIITQSDAVSSGTLAAMTPRQRLAVEQNAEVVRTIFDIMNARSIARISAQEKTQ